jgi:uncharacterized protein
MLSFDIRSLESQAAHVEGQLAPDDGVWEDGDARPSKPIRVEGRLSAAGPFRFYFSGRFSGEAEAPCRRCLTPVGVQVDEEAHFIFSSEGDDSSDDPDVYPFDANAPRLDLRPAVREAWLLVVPGFLLCREDCKGLCATCGIDLNIDACEHSHESPQVKTDSRWDSLRAVRDQQP